MHAPAAGFQFFDDLADGFFVVFVGNQRGIVGVDHDAVLESQRDDQVIARRANNGSFGIETNVLADDGVPVFVAAQPSFQR